MQTARLPTIIFMIIIFLSAVSLVRRPRNLGVSAGGGHVETTEIRSSGQMSTTLHQYWEQVGACLPAATAARC